MNSAWSEESAGHPADTMPGIGYTRRGWRVVMVAITLAVSACSTTPSPDKARVVWGEDLNRVQIQPAPPGADTAGAIDVSPAQLRTALAQLRFRARSGDVRPVFTQDTLDRMAEPLSRGLGRLQAGEDLVFAVTQKSAAGKQIISVFRDATLTTGRMFVANNRLNVIFGRMHAAFEDAYHATDIAPPLKPGRRDEPANQGWAMLETKFAEYASQAREDWLVIEPAAWQMPRTTSSESTSDAGPNTTPVTGTTQPVNPYYRRTRKRLEAIERLRDDGLLSEQEYRDLRARILEDLAEPQK